MENFRAIIVYLAAAALLSAFHPCFSAEGAGGGDVEGDYMRYIALKTSDGLLAKGETREAFAYIDSVLPKVPEKDKLFFLLIKIETALIDSGRGTREGFRTHMSVLLADGKYSEAIDLAGATLSVARPSSPANIDNYIWIMTMLADAYHRTGDPGSAINTLSQAQSLKDTYELHAAKASIYASEGKFKEAAQEYSEAVRLNPGEPGIYEAKAWNLRTLGRVRDAENDLLAGLALDPDNPRLLKAAAYHYRDRRYYRKSLEYAGRYLDTANPEKTKYLENRDLRDIYFKTDFDGYRVTPYLSGSVSNEFYSEISNIENMIRGTKSSGINVEDADELQVPHNTRRDKVNAKITYQPQKYFPLAHFYYEIDKSFARIDPLVEKQRTYYMLELENTFYTPLLGDLTVYPYFKYAYLQGSDIDIRSAFTSEFNIDMYSPAVRALACPVFGKFYIESEYVYGYGDFVSSNRDLDTHQARLKLTNIFSDTSWHSAELTANYTIQHPSEDSDLRLQFISELDKRLSKSLRWVMLNKFIYHKDYLNMQNDQNVVIYRPETGFVYSFNDSFSTKGTIGYFTDFDIKKYNYLTSDISLSYKGKLSPMVLRGNNAVRYDTPMEFTVGYRNDNFLEFPADARTNFNSVYCRARLFW
ncbi:MAG: hypothetical protein PHE80_01590 [Candidatus Omnitrophica bacterium]|nr:hypothetical protein [Candidatus Omnitrophota bacterium]MDD5736955.1 hypothetical protein [Candidatus Omnitrophota bacterium]